MKSRYKLVAFDVDGTLVDDTVFVWESIHNAYRTDPVERKRIFDDYFAGALSYEEWFNEDIRLLREAGATRDGLMKVVASMKLMGGAREALVALREAGAKLVIISGSIDLVVRYFGLDALVDRVYCSDFHFDEAGRLVGGRATPFDIEAKADGLREAARLFGVQLSETAFVGDNFNDVQIAQAAGISIAFNCKSAQLAQVASHLVPGGDMRPILPLLVNEDDL